MKLFGESFFVQHAEHSVFAIDAGHDRNAEVHTTALVADAEAAVLRNAAFGDVQITHDFNARKNSGVPFLGDWRHRVLQHAVNPIFYDNFDIARFDVDVTSAAFERGENN